MMPLALGFLWLELQILERLTVPVERRAIQAGWRPATAHDSGPLKSPAEPFRRCPPLNNCHSRLKKIITLFAGRGSVELVSRVYTAVYGVLGPVARRLASQLRCSNLATRLCSLSGPTARA